MKAILHGGKLDGTVQEIDKLERWLSFGLLVSRVIHTEFFPDGKPKAFKVAMPAIGHVQEVEIINYHIEGDMHDYDGSEETLNYYWQAQ